MITVFQIGVPVIFGREWLISSYRVFAQGPWRGGHVFCTPWLQILVWASSIRREGIYISQGPGCCSPIAHPLPGRETVSTGWAEMLRPGMTVLVRMGRESGETAVSLMVTLDTGLSLQCDSILFERMDNWVDRSFNRFRHFFLVL